MSLNTASEYFALNEEDNISNVGVFTLECLHHTSHIYILTYEPHLRKFWASWSPVVSQIPRSLSYGTHILCKLGSYILLVTHIYVTAHTQSCNTLQHPENTMHSSYVLPCTNISKPFYITFDLW